MIMKGWSSAIIFFQEKEFTLGILFEPQSVNLALRPANERRRYFVTTSLNGWAQAWNQPCQCINMA